MATKINFSFVFLVVLAKFMVMFSIQAKADEYHHQLKETKLFGYFHDYSSGGPNATDFPVVGLPGRLWRYDQFGTLYVFDDPLTEGPEPTSPKLGRFQATTVTVSLDGQNVHTSGSVVFTNEAYNGSTIQILGVTNQFNFIGEYAVTSGTGKFRYASGFVTTETLFFDPTPSISYVLLRLNVTIRHY